MSEGLRQYCIRKKLAEKKKIFRTGKLIRIERSKRGYQERKKYPHYGLCKMKRPRKSTIAAIGAGNW